MSDGKVLSGASLRSVISAPGEGSLLRVQPDGTVNWYAPSTGENVDVLAVNVLPGAGPGSAGAAAARSGTKTATAQATAADGWCGRGSGDMIDLPYNSTNSKRRLILRFVTAVPAVVPRQGTA